jgi:hypothetical protein
MEKDKNPQAEMTAKEVPGIIAIMPPTFDPESDPFGSLEYRLETQKESLELAIRTIDFLKKNHEKLFRDLIAKVKAADNVIEEIERTKPPVRLSTGAHTAIIAYKKARGDENI